MEKRTLTKKDASIALFVAFICAQLSLIVGKTVLSVILAYFKNSNQIFSFFSGPWGYLTNSIFQLVAFVGVYIYYFRNTKLNTQHGQQKFNIKYCALFVGLGLLSMLCLTTFVNYFCLTLNLLNKPSAIFSFQINTPTTLILTLISSAIIPAIGEELLFRGVIFNALKEKGSLYATIVSSLFFALFHFNLSQSIYPFLFGLILGFSYAKTKNILVPMLIHFFNNATNIVLQYFLNPVFAPSAKMLVIMIIGVLLFVLIMALLFVLSYKESLKEEIAPKQEKQKYKPKTFKEFIKSETFLFVSPLVFMVFLYIILV